MTAKIIVGLLLASAAAAPAAAADIATLAAAYGARPSAWGVHLSPDGDKIVYFTPVGTNGTAAVVADVATGATKIIFANRDNTATPDWCRFKTQDRVICGLSSIRKINGLYQGEISRIVSMPAGGGPVVELGTRGTTSQWGGGIIDWLPDDPKHVLMMSYVAQGETIGSLIDKGNGAAVRKVDVATNLGGTVEAPNPSVLSYGGDNRGNIRFKSIGTRDPDGYTRDAQTLMVRDVGSKEWRRIGSSQLSGRRAIEFNGFDADGKSIYVLKDLDGRSALYKLAADGTDGSELVFSHPSVDVDGVVQIGKNRRPVAVSYTLEATQYKFFDPVLEKRVRALSNALPGKPSVTVFDESWDGVRELIFAGGVGDPGIYYRFDTSTKQMGSLLPVRPELAGLKTAEQTEVSFTAADGTKVPAYLTLPPGGPAKGLPAILMPHGGPSARDSLGFDWLSQFYAQLGYAVLQPNYRGSAGYGASWLNGNAFKSWKIAMSDINDGARWLVSQGIAAPGKLVIVGWSYGGYAALQANVLDPKLYRAAVAIAPVTDLQLLKTMSYSKIVDNEIGDGPHITEGSPAKNAAKIQVPVLIFQGDQDLNVDPKQAKAMDAALASAGKVHRLVMYPGLDHQLDDSAARADMLKQSAEFIAATLAK